VIAGGTAIGVRAGHDVILVQINRNEARAVAEKLRGVERLQPSVLAQLEFRRRERADGRSASVHGDRINANGVDGFDEIAGGSRLRGGKDRDIDDARRQRGGECRGETFTG